MSATLSVTAVMALPVSITVDHTGRVSFEVDLSEVSTFDIEDGGTLFDDSGDIGHDLMVGYDGGAGRSTRVGAAARLDQAMAMFQRGWSTIETPTLSGVFTDADE